MSEHLVERNNEHQEHEDLVPKGGRMFPLPSEKIALRVFLAVVTVLFSLTVIVYSDRMSLADWRAQWWSCFCNTFLYVAAGIWRCSSREEQLLLLSRAMGP